MADSTASLASSNYIEKLNWRGESGREVRTEGFIEFMIDEGLEYPTGDNNDITLIHRIRRPDGNTALVVGTKTGLWLLHSLVGGGYVEEGVFESGVHASEPIGWIQIGSGFNGERWEVLDIDEYVVFNNGVDLPVTYRIGDTSVTPIHELRMQGVGAVGSIAELNGHLLVGNILEVNTERMDELLSPLESGEVTAFQSGHSAMQHGRSGHLRVSIADDGTAKTHGFIPHESDIGMVIRLENGVQAVIENNVTFGEEGNQRYQLKFGTNKQEPSGMESGMIVSRFSLEFSGVVTIPNETLYWNPSRYDYEVGESFPSIELVSSRGQFNTATHAVLKASLLNGNCIVGIRALGVALVTTYSGSYDYTEQGSFGFIFDGDTESPWGQGSIVSSVDLFPVSHLVTISNPDSGDFRFTRDMVGETLVWESGEERTILYWISPTSVAVDSALPVSAAKFMVTNPDAYGRFDDKTYVDRTGYRIAYSGHSRPRMWQGLSMVTARNESKWLKVKGRFDHIKIGDELLVAEAGEDGSNLFGTVVSRTANRILLDTPALNDIKDTPSILAESYGFNVGFNDLQDDGSAILQMRKLKGHLVIYKETSIFTASYSGNANNPFSFRLIYGGANTGDVDRNLRWKHTVVTVGGHYHLYAGRSGFYRIDLTHQMPQEIPALKLVSRSWFKGVRQLEEEHSGIEPHSFAVDNPITREVWFIFGQMGGRMLRYDYDGDSVSTSDFSIAAGEAMPRPEIRDEGQQVIKSPEDWFIMSTGNRLVVNGVIGAPVEMNVMGRIHGGMLKLDSGTLYLKRFAGWTIVMENSSSVYRLTSGNAEEGNWYHLEDGTPLATSDQQIQKAYLIPRSWSRLGQGYESSLKTGLNHFGDPLNIKDIRSYQPMFSISPELDIPLANQTVILSLLGSRNAGERPRLMFTKHMTKPYEENLIPCFFREHYFQEHIRMTGRNNPMWLMSRTFEVSQVQSEGHGRRPL